MSRNDPSRARSNDPGLPSSRGRFGTEDVGRACLASTSCWLVGVMSSSPGSGLTLEPADGQLARVENDASARFQMVVPSDECGGSPCANRTIHRAARSGGAIPTEQ